MDPETSPSGSISAGLTELSDSQHNARSQIAMPPSFNKGIKRDLPQPDIAEHGFQKWDAAAC
ncbi:unnamed protein product [Parascedosporium putredinis]|uniref:Uncharacterized protein n=1 Tax=Parascedosporium putredinis TaxID=1442378 RepID=A0A9P1M7A8_9PEZI|nr:unnamed protein product [Parascedosporium putredinis]CAI7991284.1 unnamed protein product [Parascedosporium putredinis]